MAEPITTTTVQAIVQQINALGKCEGAQLSVDGDTIKVGGDDRIVKIDAGGEKLQVACMFLTFYLSRMRYMKCADVQEPVANYDGVKDLIDVAKELSKKLSAGA